MRRITTYVILALSAFFSLTAAFPAAGQDTLSIQERSLRWNDPVLGIGTLSSQRHSSISFLDSPLPSLSEAKVEFKVWGDDAPRVPQEGDGLTEGSFKATSLHRLGKDSAVGGGATYRRGVRRNVRWNSSSDYRVVYPYVMADSLGGDMQTETYSFYGKYARRTGSGFVFGLEGNYRALHEYRTVDPRPRNITSDFGVNLTGGMPLGERYVADLSASYRRYHQQQSVEYINNLGAKAPQLHLTGLGSHYARFEGNGAYLNTRYRGQGFGISAGLRPRTLDGFIAGASYLYFQTVRHLIGQNEAPYLSLGTHTLSGYVALRRTSGSWRYGIEAKVSHELRDGHEMVIDNVSTGIYDDIYDLSMYRGRALDMSVEGALSKGSVALTPLVGYKSMDIIHRFPQRTLSYSHLYYGIGIRYNAPSGEWQPILGAQARMYSSTRKSLGIPAEHTYRNLLEFYSTQFGNLSDSYALLSLDAGVQRSLGKLSALKVALTVDYIPHFAGGKGVAVQGTVGFLF